MTLKKYKYLVTSQFREWNEIVKKLFAENNGDLNYATAENRKNFSTKTAKLLALEDQAEKLDFLTFSLGELQKKFSNSLDFFPLKLEDLIFSSRHKSGPYVTLKLTTKTDETIVLNGRIVENRSQCKSGKPIAKYLQQTKSGFVLKEDQSFPGFSNFENLSITLTQESIVNRDHRVCRTMFSILDDREVAKYSHLEGK